MKCNVCLASDLDEVVSLLNYPLNSIYLKKEQLVKTDRYNPRDFSVYICNRCSHFQAVSGVKLDELYNDEYNYNTQNSGVQGRIGFFLTQLKQIENLEFNRVIDIGCYDLSLLKVVKQKIKANHYIGIDPSIPVSQLKNEEGIICFKDYVDNVDIPYFRGDMPDLIISDQTFEHIPTINKTLGNIKAKVSENSLFAICVPSMEVLMEKLNFHNLIHEHVNYFSINTLTHLFDLNQLSLRSYTLNYVSTCGFLFGLFVKRKEQPAVALGSNIFDKTYFLTKYNLFKSLLNFTGELMADLKNERLFGFGASDITANLAYFMNTDFSNLEGIIDDTAYKQNSYYPFLKPEIVSQKEIGDVSDANCLITSPQAARYIYNRINPLNFKKIINPIGLIA
jgi:hypothetical protein